MLNTSKKLLVEATKIIDKSQLFVADVPTTPGGREDLLICKE